MSSRWHRPGATLMEIYSPFSEGDGGLWVYEQPDADSNALLQRIMAGTYDRPFVLESDGTRALHFSMAFVQSAMRLKAPFALELAYTRKMMSFLLFAHQPQSILMLGLGGGSLAKYCHHHLPQARITAVEISPDVLALGTLFDLPPEDGRFRIVQADAAEHVADCDERHDVILVDAFDQTGAAPAVSNPIFYANLRKRLTQHGVLVTNLAGSHEDRLAHLELIQSVFEDNLLTLPVLADGNTILIAFCDPAFEPRWQWITSEAPAMKKRYGLDFPRYAKKLERGRKLGGRHHALALLGIG